MSADTDVVQINEMIAGFTGAPDDSVEELSAALKDCPLFVVSLSVQHLIRRIVTDTRQVTNKWQALTRILSCLTDDRALFALVGLFVALLPKSSDIIRCMANGLHNSDPDHEFVTRIESLCLSLMSTSSMPFRILSQVFICVDPLFGVPVAYSVLTLSARLGLPQVFSILLYRYVSESSDQTLMHRRVSLPPLTPKSKNCDVLPLTHALSLGGLTSELSHLIGVANTINDCPELYGILRNELFVAFSGFTPLTLAASSFVIPGLRVLLKAIGSRPTFEVLRLLARGGGYSDSPEHMHRRATGLPYFQQLIREAHSTREECAALALETLFCEWTEAFHMLRSHFDIDLMAPVSVGPCTGQRFLITAVLVGSPKFVAEILRDTCPDEVLVSEDIPRGLTALTATLAFLNHISHYTEDEQLSQLENRREVLQLVLDAGWSLPIEQTTRLFCDASSALTPTYVVELFLERGLLDLTSPRVVVSVARSSNIGALEMAFSASNSSDLGVMIAATVEGGNAQCVEYLASRVDKQQINFRGEDGLSPLDIAAHSGNESAVRILLSHGADPKAASPSGVTPLHIACRHSHHRCAGLLINSGADVLAVDSRGRTVLMEAVKANSSACIRTLIGAAEALDPPMTDTLVRSRDSRGRSVLDIAVIQNSLNSVLVLLRCGAFPRADPEQATRLLVEALQFQAFDVVRSLLSAGASPNAPDVSGLRPIHHAVNSNAPESVFVSLVSSGCNLNLFATPPSRPETALTLAARCLKTKIIKVLVVLGADPEFSNGEGTTARQILKSANCDTSSIDANIPR